jgi:hypothetical protein
MCRGPGGAHRPEAESAAHRLVDLALAAGPVRPADRQIFQQYAAGGRPMAMPRSSPRIANETARDDDREWPAIAMIAHFSATECVIWADVERERVNQEQLG